MDNRILRFSISILLILALFFTGLFYYLPSGYASDTKVTQTVTHYKFITAVVFIWGKNIDKLGKDPEWKPKAPGEDYTHPTSTTLNKDAKNISIYKYTHGDFDMTQPNVEGRVDAGEYRKKYYKHSTTEFSATKGKFSNGNLNYTWTAKMASYGPPYDVKSALQHGRQQDIIDLMGGMSPEMAKFLQKREEDAKEFDKHVQGYLYFVPYIIQYDLEEEVEPPLELTARLNLPGQSPMNENYNVSDGTILPKKAKFKDSTLERNDGTGWEMINDWDGTKLGSSITQLSSKEGAIQYRLTVNLETGESDTDTKTINIIDGTIVDANVKLSLPEYTYEGHPVIAEDDSTYTVDGEFYSALRAYAERKARNRFSIIESGAGRISKNRGSDVEATARFPNKGHYNVQLKIYPKNSSSLTDIKPIEVRKTPTVITILGGAQKQNRKQILNIKVATSPDNPLKQIWAEVKNLETGESVHLDHNLDGKENVLDNTDGIKTRPIKALESDECWTNCQLLFLTKNTKPEKFKYTVYAKDSRGLWDKVEKEFIVQPDLPPQAKISVQGAFFRGKGTNTAKIEMEDISSTDGDQLDRSWYITEDCNVDENFKGETENKAEIKDGFLDNSFGTKKIIQVNKIGVGKVKIRLHIKDVWTEETLPEYITDADYLTAETTAMTKVDNIAPIVSLKPINSRTADILLLAGNTEEYYKLKNGINTMQSYFLGNAIDANIVIKEIGECIYTDNKLDRFKHLTQNTNANIIGYTDYEINGYAVDDKYLYLLECIAGKGEYYTFFKPPYKLRAIDIETEKDVWTYTFNEETFPIGFDTHGATKNIIEFDNEGEYVYIVRNEKTLILDRDNGSYLTTLNFEIGKNNYIFNDFIYSFKEDGIYRINRKSGEIKRIIDTKGTGDAIRMIASEIQFFTIKDTPKRGIFNPKTQTVKYENLEKIDNKLGLKYNYTGVCIDSIGKIVLKSYSNYKAFDEDQNCSFQVFSSKNKLIINKKTEGGIDGENRAKEKTIYPIFNSNEECNYIAFASDHHRKGGDYDIYVDCYRISDGKTLGYHFEGRNGYPTSDIVMYGIEMDNGNVYVVTPAGPYTHPGENRQSKMLKINFITDKVEIEHMGNINLWDGSRYTKKSNRYLAMRRDEKIGISRTNLTMDFLINNNMITYLSNNGDVKLVMLLDENNKSMGDEFEKTIAKLKSYGYKFIQITDKKDHFEKIICDAVESSIIKIDNLFGAIKNESEEQIKQEKVVRLKAKNSNGIFSKNIDLEPSKEYHFSYEIKQEKPKNGEGFFLEPNTILSENKIYYSTSSRAEPYMQAGFDILEKRRNRRSGEYLRLTPQIKEISFVVPAGQKAVMSFDYNMIMTYEVRYGGKVRYSDTNYFKLNDEVIVTAEENDLLAGFYSSKKPLEPGSYRFTFSNGGGTVDTDDEHPGSTSLYNFRLDFIEEGFLKDVSINRAIYEPIKVITKNWRGDDVEHTEFKLLSRENQKTKLYVESMKFEDFNDNDDLEFKVSSTDYFEEKYGRTSKKRKTWSASGISTSGRLCVMATTRGRDVSSSNTVTVNIPKGKKGKISFDYEFEEQDKWVEGAKITINDIVAVNKSLMINSVIPNKGHYESPLLGEGEYKILLYICSLDGGTAGALDNLKVEYLTHTPNSFKKIENARDNIDKWNKIEGTIYSPPINNEYIFFSDMNKFLLSGTTSTANIGFKLNKEEYSIRNLRMYYNENGRKVYVNGIDIQTEEQLNTWTKNDLKAALINQNASKMDEDKLIYKKGELVAYGISYYDYESDPSKKQYWRYTHTPFNDGTHPNAATVLDEDGNVVSQDLNKVLNQPIQRFYVDGKYTVEHWQEDNTNRLAPDYKAVNPNGHPLYDKASNIERLTFYVEGGASAPWITSIKTIPTKVKEGQAFQIQVGVDDMEKDELRLTTEVYKDKKLIYTHRKTGIKATNGIYPLTTTSTVQKEAQIGRYEVVCTVRDQTGAGIGTYRFTVISEGKITGMVYHTEKWDENRKKYNLHRFKEEVNRA